MLFVAGCHRSGTSFLAGLLRATADRIGLSNALQDDAALQPPTFDNQLGYYESRSLMAANEAILKAFDAGWERPWLQAPDFTPEPVRRFLVSLRPSLAAHCQGDFWIDKDPRLCLTREAFRHILSREIATVAILRHPMEVARSLHARDGFAIERGLALWSVYNFALLGREGAAPAHCFDYGDFTSPAGWPVDRLRAALHHLWQPWMHPSQAQSLTAELLQDTIAAAFRGSLNRQCSPALLSAGPVSRAPLLADCTEQAWQRLKHLMHRDQLTPPAAREALAPAITTLLAQPQEIRGWIGQADQAQGRLLELQALVRQRSDELTRSAERARELAALHDQVQHLERMLERSRADHGALNTALQQAKLRAGERRARIQELRARLAWNRALVVSLRALLAEALTLLHRLRRSLGPRCW